MNYSAYIIDRISYPNYSVYHEFVITNKAGKLVGFWLQDLDTHTFLDKFPLQPGETRTTRVQITEHGFRYRYPINPTPWYDVAVSK